MKNIIKRGKVYYLRVMLQGKVYQRSLGPDLREARKKGKRLLEQLQEERETAHPSSAPTTFQSFSHRWLEEYVSQRRTAENVEKASQRLRDYILPVLGQTPISDVSVSLLRGLRGKLDASHLSVTSVIHIMSDVRCLFSYALEVGVVTSSPWRSSLMPRQKEVAPQRLSDEQVEEILLHTPERYQLPLRLALLTGIRWGELHNLEWRNVVDLPRPHLVLENTKSGKVRRVPLSEEAQQLLRQAPRKGKYVVAWRSDNPGSVVRRIGKKAGVRWHWHQLRHTFACRWLDAGGSKESLQKILGHSTITLTERYGQMSDGAVFGEMERLSIVTKTVTSNHSHASMGDAKVLGDSK